VAGDWWFHDVAPSGGVRVLLGDVTGHGAGSAMVTAAIAGCYRALKGMPLLDTPQILERMHHVVREICNGSYHMPLAALELAKDRGEVRWWSAAAPPLLVLRRNGEIETKVARSTPLGADEFALGYLSFNLEPGDRMLVFSDGVEELEITGGRTLGLRRLANMLAAGPSGPVTAIRDALCEALMAACGETPLNDDLTLVVLARKDGSPGVIEQAACD